MQTALLATKLFIPPVRPGIVQRPRLLEKLSGALNCSLTLVSAPAGFGKTTLISEWVHQTKPPIPTAWLSLEESENDPVRFWQYLIAALRTVQPEIAEAAQSLLRSSQPVPTESAVTALVNDIAGMRSDVLLVLDDYHFINSEAVHKGVAFLLDHLPPMVHLIIATRVDPPLPMAHFRGKGMLSEIRTDDLRFMPEETAKLLSVPGRARLSPENVNALNARTGGWVVGLKMASLSMPEGKDVAAFVAEFAGTQRYVMDYLMEEVLERQTEDLRRFLLQTSVLDRLTGPLCDAVTGGRYGNEMLFSLEKANLFVVPLDESSQWYRYEHLFAELLRHRLQIEMGKQAVEELQKRASHWYESNGFHESAINHALASRDWGLAVDLIAASRPTSVAAYGGATTLNWLRQVPEGILLARPEGWTQYAWALGFTGQLDAEKAFLDRYEKSPAYDPATAGQIALLRTHVGSYQGDPRTEEYARKALSLLPQRGDNVLLGVVRLHLGIYYVLRQRFSEAEDALTEACESFRGIDDGFAISQALTYLAIATTMRGGLHRGEEMLRQAVLKAPHHPNTAIAHMYLAIIYFWWNDLETSTSELKKALALNPPPVFLRMLYLYSALRPLAQGDVTAAAEALGKAEAVPVPNADALNERARIAAYHVALAIEQGDSESISRWLDRMSEYDGFLVDIPSVAMRLRHERQGEALEKRLKEEYETFRAQGPGYSSIAILIDRAVASTDPDEALSCLAEALTLGRPEGFIRPFVGWGMSLARLLRRAISRGIEPDYARKLMSIIEAEERQRNIRRRETPGAPPARGLLTERELQVLRLVEEGLSDREIATRLVVSLTTAKTHVRHVFDKLDVGGRVQAVTRARELKLI